MFGFFPAGFAVTTKKHRLSAMAQTIAVLSQKGGTGKTTTVRTLTDAFRRSGLRVLAIDLAPQGNLSDYFDLDPDASPTIAEVLMNVAPYERPMIIGFTFLPATRKSSLVFVRFHPRYAR